MSVPVPRLPALPFFAPQSIFSRPFVFPSRDSSFPRHVIYFPINMHAVPGIGCVVLICACLMRLRTRRAKWIWTQEKSFVCLSLLSLQYDTLRFNSVPQRLLATVGYPRDDEQLATAPLSRSAEMIFSFSTVVAFMSVVLSTAALAAAAWAPPRDLLADVLSYSNAFYILPSLCIVQVFHELSHGIAAAAQGVAVQSFGVYLVLFCLPVFYTACETPRRGSARTIAAGLTFNVLFAGLLALSLGLNAYCLDTFSDTLREGLEIASVGPTTLAHYLQRGDIVTRIDDLSLNTTSPARLAEWSSLLGSDPDGLTPQNMGWCLQDLAATPLECCIENEDASPSAVCMATQQTPRLYGCVNPTLIFADDSDAGPERCIDSCAHPGQYCAAPRAPITRIRYSRLLDRRSGLWSAKTIVFEGHKTEIRDHVAVTDRVPTIPLYNYAFLGIFHTFLKYLILTNFVILLCNSLAIPYSDGTKLLQATVSNPNHAYLLLAIQCITLPLLAALLARTVYHV